MNSSHESSKQDLLTSIASFAPCDTARLVSSLRSISPLLELLTDVVFLSRICRHGFYLPTGP